MSLTIALAGNPNSGKTTLFNALTGANQFVGNWPGVTVEKKEGRLKKNLSGGEDVKIADLPGIYSLSPYTLEEVVARNYLLNDKPDAIINIIDGTNIERNLYLTTQLTELGIPVVMAVNMADLVVKNGDKVRVDKIGEKFGCPVVSISALKGTGIEDVARNAVNAAKTGKLPETVSVFDDQVEDAISEVSDRIGSKVPEKQRRFVAIKLLESDDKIGALYDGLPDASDEIGKLENAMDDDVESIITNERYTFISGMIKECVTKKDNGGSTVSDKIDKVVTNRILALPIFALIMIIVYYVSVTTVGTWWTDWANDGVFGDGWCVPFTDGRYNEAVEEYDGASDVVMAFLESEEFGDEGVAALMDTEAEDFDPDAAVNALKEWQTTKAITADAVVSHEVEDEETLEVSEEEHTGAELMEAIPVIEKYGAEAPDPSDNGAVFVPGIPVLVENLLGAIGVPEDGWLHGLIMDGIVAGVGAVLGFVPQILLLFIFLAFLEGCGYMARIAFILDRIFRRFGLSGKSFIPILVGTGCGIPGIMASRTIENENDRRMTIMTTTFIPCGAKLPFIAMVAGALFGGAAWVAPSAYFLGMGAIIISGIILKKTKLFLGDPAPFVMELPAYHLPTIGSVLRSMWERGWSFIKKAGTIILLSTIVIWFLSFFGWVDGEFRMLSEDEISNSILAYIGSGISWLFAPLGWGDWQATVASVTGLVAKENIVGTMGILYSAGDGSVWANMASAFGTTSIVGLLAGYSFLAFNLLCAPCFAAMGAIKREMNSTAWFWRAIGYQCGFAYLVAMCIYQIGCLVTGNIAGVQIIFQIISVLVVLCGIWLLVRKPSQRATTLKINAKLNKI
ncbi:MAG: ferrous iron transporter B [Eubacterium sp.]|nr:ferrous iron transporter B [Eubacterium sp.]